MAKQRNKPSITKSNYSLPMEYRLIGLDNKVNERECLR